jgi:hypothetical protein
VPTLCRVRYVGPVLSSSIMMCGKPGVISPVLPPGQPVCPSPFKLLCIIWRMLLRSRPGPPSLILSSAVEFAHGSHANSTRGGGRQCVEALLLLDRLAYLREKVPVGCSPLLSSMRS